MASTRRERNLFVFQRKPVHGVFFQPRFEPWFWLSRQNGTLPAHVRDLSLFDLYDRLGASMRTLDFYTGLKGPLISTCAPEVKILEHRDGNTLRKRIDTPHGTLYESFLFNSDKVWRRIEFPAKAPADLKALRWLLARQSVRFDPAIYAASSAAIGDRGEAHFWVPKSPYFAMAQVYMKYEDFVYALADCPREMEETFKVIDATYDPLYADLTRPGPLRIVNFGENVAMAYLSIEYFERYVLPWYEARAAQLRAAGVFTHVHIDGYFRPLLPYLASLPFDGLEALTPTPQGDVTIEEMREYIGDKILLDGIPAVLFLNHYPLEALQECVEKIVKSFHPRLVLGVSDEFPEGADAHGFAKLEWLADWCRSRDGNGATAPS
jgi:hypothetical protein